MRRFEKFTATVFHEALHDQLRHRREMDIETEFTVFAPRVAQWKPTAEFPVGTAVFSGRVNRSAAARAIDFGELNAVRDARENHIERGINQQAKFVGLEFTATEASA